MGKKNILRKVKFGMVPCISYIKAQLAKLGIKNNSIILFEALAEGVSHDVSSEGFEIRIASERDLREYGYYSEDIIQRLANGHLCFIAVLNGQMAGHSWISLSSEFYIPEVERNVSLESSCAYQYDGRVFAKFRGRGIHRKLIRENLRYLKSLNIRKAWAHVDAANKTSLKTALSLQARPIRSISLLKIFGFKRYGEAGLR